MATEKIDVKNVRMNKSNVLVRGRGKKTQEICAVDEYKADWIKCLDKQKRLDTTAAWLNGVAALTTIVAGSLLLTGDPDKGDQFLAGVEYLIGVFNLFLFSGNLPKAIKSKKLLKDEYVEAIEKSQVNTQEEMVK